MTQDNTVNKAAIAILVAVASTVLGALGSGLVDNYILKKNDTPQQKVAAGSQNANHRNEINNNNINGNNNQMNNGVIINAPVQQNSSGACSPNLSGVQGNVTLDASGCR